MPENTKTTDESQGEHTMSEESFLLAASLAALLALAALTGI